MPAKRKNTRKPTNGKKQANPGLNLVLKRLDKKIDQRFDALDRGIDTVDRKVDAVRQETAAEFKAVREETAQGFANMEKRTAAEFKTVRAETAQGFDALWQKFKAEMKHVSDAAYEHYLRIETDAKSRAEYYQKSLNNLQTGMDPMTKKYEQFGRDSAIIDAEHQDLKSDVETLKKRDMEKAAAIEKIEKEVDKLKAA